MRHHDHAGIFLLPNGTFFVELVVFLVLIFLISKYVLPPVNKAMEERQEKIRASLEAAERARADAEAADDERRAVLEEARHQAREIVATANRTAEQVRTDAQATGQAEYERIVGNAEAEIELARQRAVEEAAARMGEIVLEVVERVIGREVDAEAHRDLIDEAVAALQADTAGGAGRRRRGAAVNPTLQGYAAAVLEAAGPADARPVADDLEAVEQLVLANAHAPGGADRHRRARPAAPGGRARPAEDKVSPDGPPPGRLRRVMVVPAPEVTGASLGWPPGRATLGRRAADRGAGAEPAAGPPPGRRLRHRGLRGPVHRRARALEDELFRFARIVESTPALRGAADRPRPAGRARARASSPNCSRARSPATSVRWPLRRHRRAGPRHRGHAGLAGRADGAGPGLAGGPRRAAAPVDDDAAGRLSESLRTLVGCAGRAAGR